MTSAGGGLGEPLNVKFSGFVHVHLLTTAITLRLSFRDLARPTCSPILGS